MTQVCVKVGRRRRYVLGDWRAAMRVVERELRWARAVEVVLARALDDVAGELVEGKPERP